MFQASKKSCRSNRYLNSTVRGCHLNVKGCHTLSATSMQFSTHQTLGWGVLACSQGLSLWPSTYKAWPSCPGDNPWILTRHIREKRSWEFLSIADEIQHGLRKFPLAIRNECTFQLKKNKLSSKSWPWLRDARDAILFFIKRLFFDFWRLFFEFRTLFFI